MSVRIRAVLLGVGLALAGCAKKPPATAHDMPASGVPSWVPAYSKKQLALLAPVDQPIQTPVSRVFPNLGRFGYAANRPLTSLEEPLKVTKMFATILTESTRFYSLQEAAPDLANTVAQYGPIALAESDGWSVVVRKHGGEGELVPAGASPDARADFDRAEKLAVGHELASALATLSNAARKGPGVPAIRLALGRALAASGRAGEAETEYQQGIAIDPTYAPLHVALAEIAEGRQDSAAARHELAEALAYQPTSPSALEVLHRIGDGGLRVRPMVIFLDVDAVGAIHVATGAGTAAQMYGGCRAVMRYEPEWRSALNEEPMETPYFLSITEEVMCVEAALGAYLFDRASDPEAPADPSLDKLLELAHEEGLAGYVMFEILGQHRPERARLAPPHVHAAMVRYVEQHVLGDSVAPEGVYTASR